MSPAKPGSVALHLSTCLPFPLHPSAVPASRASVGLVLRRKQRNDERKKQNRYRWQGYFCPGRADG